MKLGNSSKKSIIIFTLYISIWILLYFLPRTYMHIGGTDGITPWLLFATIFFLLPYLLYTGIIKKGINPKEKYKKYESGIITDTNITSRKSGSVWTVQATYKVNNKILKTSFKRDKNKTLLKGDTINIIYSSKTPQMSEIKELIEYYGK